MSASDFDRAVDQYRLALGDFVRGNPKPVLDMFSRRENVCLANPYGPPALGRKEVEATAERAASYLSEGETTGFETVVKHVTPDLAYVVEVEHYKGKVGEKEGVSPWDLRVTMIFCRERGTWKVLHRQADPITSVRPAESVVQK